MTSRTRLETLTEARANPLPEGVRTIIRLETNGGIWEELESDGDPLIQLRSLRQSIRASLDRFLLEAIERGRGLLFSTIEASTFYLQLRSFVVYDTRDAEGAIDDDLMPVRGAAPDCAFDAAFGYACSAKQKERVAKAAKDGVVLDVY